MESLHVLSYNVVQKQRDKRSEDYERESSKQRDRKKQRDIKGQVLMVCLKWTEDCLLTYNCSNPCTFNLWFPSSMGIPKGFPSCQGINTRFPSLKGIVQIIYRGPIPFRPRNQCQIPKILGNHLRVPFRLGNQYSVPVDKRNHTQFLAPIPFRSGNHDLIPVTEGNREKIAFDSLRWRE